MNSNKKILVLGHRGLLGNAIIQRSKNWNHEVIGWGREDLDVTDKEQVLSKIKKLNPDTVINCTALTNVDLCEEDTVLADQVNGLAPGYISEATHAIDAHFIQISTDYVFDGEDRSGYKEDHTTGPINYYGQSKLTGEKQTVLHNPKHTIIRVSWIYGSDSKNIPARKDFIATILNWAESSPNLSILNNQTGKITNAFDVADSLKDFIEKPLYGIYHLCNEGELTRYDLAKTTFELLGREDITVQPAQPEDLNIQLKAQRPKFSSLINTKYKPLPNWKESLTEYLKTEYAN